MSADKYHRIFCWEYSIKFQMRKSHTCRICDCIFIKINEPSGTIEDEKKLTTEHMFHLDRAKEIQERLRTESEQAKDNPGNKYMCE
jgi:hypothetical protein